MANLQPKTFKATLNAPLFYSSSEGRTIQTRKTLSATALTYALGYTQFDLSKVFVHTGSDYTESDYSPLKNLPFIVSDMTPIDVDADERTFRSTDYRSERHFSTQDGDVASAIDSGAKGIPRLLGKSSEIASWKTMREYLGLSPGSTFRFTLISRQSIPDNLRFRMGIKRTGEISAEKKSTSETVTLNKYMLQQVYGLQEDTMQRIMKESGRFKRGNDVRLQHFEEVPIDRFEAVAEKVLDNAG